MKTGYEKQAGVTPKRGSSTSTSSGSVTKARSSGAASKQSLRPVVKSLPVVAPPLVPIRVLLEDHYGAWPIHLAVLKMDVESSEYDVLPSVWKLCEVGALTLDQVRALYPDVAHARYMRARARASILM